MNSWPRGSTAIYFGPALEAFGIQPDFTLRTMRAGQSLNCLTARLLAKLDRYLQDRAPALVLGHGDTTTCLSGALASFHRGIPFFHVEAGLRSGNLLAPFPEEFNRRSVAPLAAHHFAPTARERENLRRDGVAENKISVTGSTIEDAVHLTCDATPDPAALPAARAAVVVTLHRREAAGALDHILAQVSELALSRPDLRFLCPVHPNPAVRASFARLSAPNVELSSPLPYPQFLAALRAAPLVITDSGGVQEEAALLGRPVILARAETERQDGIAEGLVRIGGKAGERILPLAAEFFRRPPRPAPARGRPRASALIARYVAEAL